MSAPANDAPAAPPPPLPVDGPEVLTIAELAVLLRLHPESTRELACAGKIPGCRKVGGAWRAHRATVVAWLAGQDSAPPKKAGRR